MTPADQLAHFADGTNLPMTGNWYSHARVVELVKAAKAEALAEARDAIHRDGDDADAIREVLGLRFASMSVPVVQAHPHPEHGFTHMGYQRRRRVVGDWQEVSE